MVYNSDQRQRGFPSSSLQTTFFFQGFFNLPLERDNPGPFDRAPDVQGERGGPLPHRVLGLRAALPVPAAPHHALVRVLPDMQVKKISPEKANLKCFIIFYAISTKRGYRLTAVVGNG